MVLLKGLHMTDKTRDELLLNLAHVVSDILFGTDINSNWSSDLTDSVIKATDEQKKEQDTSINRTNHCRCPECGSENTDYDSAIYDHDEGCCMLFTCLDCGAEVKEVYKTTYLRSEVYGHVKVIK